MRILLTFVTYFFLSNLLFAQISPFIHVDQFGYENGADKVAVLSNPQVGFNANLSYQPSNTLELKDAVTDAVVFSGSPSPWNNNNTHTKSGDKGWWFDFSSFTTSGSYYVYDPNNDERSAIFSINENPYYDVLRAATRMFYYNRCNSEKLIQHTGPNWSDGISFMNPLQDANCRFIGDQGNAALEKDLSGGWYDAGDFNKYISFAYSSVHGLLFAYEENPSAFGDDTNIPESGNGIPDILDEIKWELDWMMKMVNTDGSTINKMGSRNYSENTSTPPSLNTDPRFYGPTCTSASAAVASVFGHAAKVYGAIASFSSFANDLEAKGIAAYDYTKPFWTANNFELNCDDLSIISGDADWTAEEQSNAMLSAAVHLYERTGNATFQSDFENYYAQTEAISASYWSTYKIELLEALLIYRTLPNADPTISNNILNSFLTDIQNNGSGYYGFNDDDLYRAEMPEWSFHWGSNLPMSNYGVLNRFVGKYNLIPNSDTYLKNAKEKVHYFHGVNPLGLVYLSNMYEFGGDHCINEIYHQWFGDQSTYDNALTSPNGPAPGYLVGGANKDFSITTNTPPAGQPAQKSYLDYNTGWPDASWEISEPSISYQAGYVRLLANYASSTPVISNIHIGAGSNYLDVFPNPVDEYFVVEGLIGNYTIEVRDANGQIFQTLSNSGVRTIINTSNLPAGLFFVRVTSTTNNLIQVQKIIKQ